MNAKRPVYKSCYCSIRAFVVVLAFLTIQVRAQQPSQKLNRHVPLVVSSRQAERLGTLSTAQKMRLSIVMPVRNQVGLTSLLRDLYDPSSPNYRQFLSVQQFTDQFSPTEKDYESVIQWAASNGFTIDSKSKNRLILDVSGTAEQVNGALNVSMNLYRDPKRERTFYSIDREPTLNLSVPVAHIEGLNNFSVPQPMVKRKKNAGPVADITGSGPGGYFLSSDMRAAYYGGTLLTGAGQSVGLFEFGGYRLSDVNLTFNNAGQSYSVPINNVLIDGASAVAGADDSEQVLDIAQAIGMAPGLSQVRVYIGTTSDADIFNKMATDDDSQGHPICKQLSVSWSWIPDDPTTDDVFFQEFAAQGQSVFVASGDSGAYDAAVSPYFYPAEDAHVTTVGGTHLTTNYGGGPWVAETVWNSPPDGSGGGISPDNIPIPSWQQAAINYSNAGSLSLRNAPDVAMEADLDNYSCDLGTCEGGFGGTSFAAPRWAGFMALINQQAVEAGTAPAGGLGFINPAIYSIGEGSNYDVDLHDITSGNNDSDNQLVWYSAVTGYDPVTGWGSPNGQDLIDGLAGPVIPGYWISPSPASLSVSQSSSTTATISLIDAGGFAGEASLTASGLPSGVTASFNPSTTAGTSVLTLTAGSSATLGTATIMITGTSGTLSSATSLFLTVNPPSNSPPSSGAFGTVNVGTTSSPSSLTLTFAAAGTLGNIAVLTQGIANLDFANAGGGSCAIGTAYAANATCTVDVTFTPRYTGIRYGAVVLTNASGNHLANLYLHGTGVGPQTTFIPGTQTAVGSGFVSPQATATLGDGSVYVTDYGSGSNGALYFDKFSNGTYTQSSISCTFRTPVGVAVDGSGTVYVADPGVPAVYKLIISNGNCSETTIGSGFSKPWGVAVDGSGDVYITDLGTSAVYKETLQPNGSYVQSAVDSGWLAPAAVAVDGSGDIDVADYGIPGVFMETPSGGSYRQTAIGNGWTAPSGIGVDGVGNIYVSDSEKNIQEYGGAVPAAVFKEVYANGNYIQTPIGSGWAVPSGIGTDARGNIYVADNLRGVYKNDFADPPTIGFANATNGAISSDTPKTVTVSNLGTAALQFSSVSYPTDFPEAAGVPTDCASNTSLASGESCTLSIEFLPTTALGTNTSLALAENVTITTNTLNTTGNQQTIPTTGTEVLPTGSVMLNVSSDPATAGTPIRFTASVAASVGGAAPTGTVTLYNGATPIAGPLSLNNGMATYSTSALAVGAYNIYAAYSGDSNYQGANSNAITENIIAAPGTSSFGNTPIGTQNVGTSSGVIPLAITFTAAETLGSIAVLTEGAPNLDFAKAGGGTCSVGTAYTINASCTVNITFTPKYSGTRYGAVVLTDNNGNVIGTGYLEGTGVGPQIVFPSGTLGEPNIGGSFAYVQGVAVDGSENIFFADALSGFVYGFSASGELTSIGTGFKQPYGLAVDAAGNIYVADVGNHAVYKETPSNGSYIQTVIGYGFIWPSGVAVDALGNVYVADFGNGVTPGAVYLETLSNGSYTQSTIGAGFVTPQSIAVDGSGNVYVADSGNGNGLGVLYKLTPSNGSYNQTTIGTGWLTPTGVAVDGNGNIFVADDAYDLGNGFVAKETLQSDGSYVQSTVLASPSVPYPGGVAVDGQGNLYVTDNFDAILYRDDLADPPALSFASTMFGSTSSDSPRTITVQNNGNSQLAFSAVSYPADFPEAPGVPSDCTSSTSLGVGAACTLTIDFEPHAALGNNQSQLMNENVALTTNSLGGSHQNVAVSGTEASPTATVALTTQANLYTVGATATFTATVTGQSGIPAPTGTVTFYSNVDLNQPTALGTAQLGANGTASYSTNSLSAGPYDITATYSGDNNYPSETSPAVDVKVIPTSGFGIENIGSSSSSTTFTVSFSAKTTLGSIAVLTEGIPNLDFTNAGTGTCKIGTAYKANSSCTVNVSFKPRVSGSRHGALVLGDNTGHLIKTIYLLGTGLGSQVTFQPASASTVIAEPSASCAQAVDSSGDIYISLVGNGGCTSIVKWVPSGGSYTQSQVPSSTLSTQISFVVDGAGNVYIADSGNGRVLKETLFGGAYSESVLATGLNTPRAITVDGNGNVYFVVGFYSSPNTYPNVYKEAPSSSGTYVQTSTTLLFANDPMQMVVDDQGDIFYKDHSVYGSGTSEYFDEAIFEETPTNINTILAGPENQTLTLDFIDGNGNLYATLEQNLLKLTQNSADLWTLSCSPVQLAADGRPPCSATLVVPTTINVWGMDGSGNFYGSVGNAVTLLKSASPVALRFAQTNAGSTSSDSPQSVTLLNIGNAPLTFSIPSTGTNPSISPNFSLDPSTTCPRISASGTVSSLAMNNACAYAIDFTPTESGTIDGSLVLSDNALNAVNGTQTVPLTGAGNAKAQVAILTAGPNGVAHVSWVPSATPLALPPAVDGEGVWVDTVHQTFVFGVAEFAEDQNGNPTCNEVGPGSFSLISDLLGGTILLDTEKFKLPNNQCPGQKYWFATVRYTWGSDKTDLQDPFVLGYTLPNGQSDGTVAFNAELAHITVTPTTQSGPNSPLTATAKLINPPVYATGYSWTITGGNGTIVFPNGQEQIPSTTTSITIQEPNPTGNSVPFNIGVDASYSSVDSSNTLPPGQDTLDYGPAEDSFCGVPTITSISPNVWFAGQSYNVTINGTGFNPTASQTCAKSILSISMANGGSVTTNVTSVTPNQITVMVTPGENDLTGGATVAVTGAPTPAPNADVLEVPVITWASDPDGSDPTITGPNAQLPNPSAVVGQQILLTTTPTADTLATLPIPLAFSNNPSQTSWQVAGTAVGGYPSVPTTPLTSGSGSLTPLSSTCSNSPTCTLYWVSTGNPLTVRYTYTLTNGQTSQPVSATFNVQGPSAISLTTPTISPVSIGFQNPQMGMFVPPSTSGIVFNASLTQPQATQGTIIFVQYLNQFNYQYTTSPSCAPITLAPGVDFAYPYDESQVGATTYSTNDSPDIPLYTNATEATASFNATMYLMWQPNLTSYPVIPVPLGYITWYWSGDAVQSGGTWSFKETPESPVASTFTASSSYPPNWIITSVPPNPPCGLHY